MQPFRCPACALVVFFDSIECVRDGTPLRFDPASRSMVAAPERSCANREAIGCNWVSVPGMTLCRSCGLTTSRPAASDDEAVQAWAGAEDAKRRLLYQLDALGLDVSGARFVLATGPDVVTGHANGVITLNLRESDDVYRTKLRDQLDEPYRTVLGHFRHEIGHFLFEPLVSDLDAFRALFGDERADYQAALDAHYSGGAPAAWRDSHVSAYAAAHPWEDWAETFAHYLHIRDGLETAAAFGLRIDASAVGDPGWGATPADVRDDSLQALLDEWLPLTWVLNAMNRSMGHEDLYPFVLAPPAVAKLQFVHALVAREAPTAA